jgi:hypothetical protein
MLIIDKYPLLILVVIFFTFCTGRETSDIVISYMKGDAEKDNAAEGKYLFKYVKAAYESIGRKYIIK